MVAVVTLGLHVFMLLLVIVMLAAGVNILPLVFEQLPLDIKDHTEYLKGLAWDYRDDNNVIADVSYNSDTTCMHDLYLKS